MHDKSEESLDIAIIYASTSGNVEYVCQFVCRWLKESGGYKNPCLYRSEAVNATVLERAQQLVLATSTWEHGALNPYFTPVYSYIQKNDMSGKTASFIGLGDTKYEPVLFCEGINMTERAWLKAGGNKRGDTLKINDLPHNQMEKVEAWLQATFGEQS